MTFGEEIENEIKEFINEIGNIRYYRSEERRVGKEWRTRGSEEG